MRHLWLAVLLTLVTCAFASLSAQQQQTDRNWNAVKDSLMRDEGIVMPVMPDSFLSTEQFLEKGICRRRFVRSDSTNIIKAYQEQCFALVRNNSVIVKRERIIDVRVGHPMSVLMVIAFSVRNQGIVTGCDVWMNERFWSGGEPNSNFTPLKESPCGANGEKFTELHDNLMSRQ